MTEQSPHADVRDTLVIAPNFKRRLSGVTSTIVQLIPVQRRLGLPVATLGPGLPAGMPHIRFRDLWRLWQRPKGAETRVWHARRNNEMLVGAIFKYILRMRLKLLFTSASQRHHSKWTRFLISIMDDVVSTSSKTATYLKRDSHVILHGIDTEIFYPSEIKEISKSNLGLPSDKKIVGCFGRIREQKGTDLFVNAMICLLPARQDWIAIVAGRVTSQHQGFIDQIKKKIDLSGLSDRILFVGEHKNISDWYRAIDLYIAPQRWEGFGLTPLEAMATAVPVVATNVGAFTDILGDDCQNAGVIVQATVDGISNGAILYMDNTKLRELASSQALTYVKRKFALENEAHALRAVYDGLLKA